VEKNLEQAKLYFTRRMNFLRTNIRNSFWNFFSFKMFFMIVSIIVFKKVYFFLLVKII
jgi:hypothetical protein